MNEYSLIINTFVFFISTVPSLAQISSFILHARFSGSLQTVLSPLAIAPLRRQALQVGQGSSSVLANQLGDYIGGSLTRHQVYRKLCYVLAVLLCSSGLMIELLLNIHLHKNFLTVGT